MKLSSKSQLGLGAVKMEPEKIQESVESFVKGVLKKAGHTIGLSREGRNWKALVELIEEKGFIDDVLGVYELTFDERLSVVSYRRWGLRRRSDTSPKDWDKPLFPAELTGEE